MAEPDYRGKRYPPLDNVLWGITTLRVSGMPQARWGRKRGAASVSLLSHQIKGVCDGKAGRLFGSAGDSLRVVKEQKLNAGRKRKDGKDWETVVSRLQLKHQSLCSGCTDARRALIMTKPEFILLGRNRRSLHQYQRLKHRRHAEGFRVSSPDIKS